MHEFISVNLHYLCNVINKVFCRGRECVIQLTDVGGFGGSEGNEGLAMTCFGGSEHTVIPDTPH